ncbi:hypothetical protein [Kozakia baliensis]|uniref:hypothetical protein n=1 Tax=Kozakia baliensis TaxID=153496 RepID=UPI00087D05D6|nr:hypothetical protein [Kozakia baliensis]AOX20595.1 hypothetical protein A0U90_10150 [Kozakia baliensis]
MGVSLADIENAIGSIGRGYASAPVMIGGMVLTGAEVPDALMIGGRQMLVVHRLVGGGRVVDALGNDPARLVLKGKFIGPEAQARAQALERMRMAGAPVFFSAAGMSLNVWIAQYRYAYEAKGAVCSYELTLERPAELMASSSIGESQSIGADIGSATSGMLDMVGKLASSAYVASGQFSTIVGQVTSMAQLLGAGGAVASVTNALDMVNGISQTGVNLATNPASAQSMWQGMEQAGAGLTRCLGQTGANLESITVSNHSALSALTQNAGLASQTADSRGLLNRAAVQVATAGGLSKAGPLIGG